MTEADEADMRLAESARSESSWGISQQGKEGEEGEGREKHALL